MHICETGYNSFVELFVFFLCWLYLTFACKKFKLDSLFGKSLIFSFFFNDSCRRDKGSFERSAEFCNQNVEFNDYIFNNIALYY